MTELFDLEIVYQEFEAAKTDDGQVLLHHFLNGYSQLTLFMDLLGTAFGFIGKDLKDKCRILRQHMEENPENFETVQSCVHYEMKNGLLKQTTPSGLPSGGRTLLRLHRALDFFIKFINRLKDIPMDGKTSGIASEVYTETLSKYHPWLIKQAGYLVMKTLPIKRTFVECYCKHDQEEVEKFAAESVAVMQQIHDGIHALFSQYDLLELP